MALIARPPASATLPGAAAAVATAADTAAAERVYHQQAALALDNHGVLLAGLVQGKAEELPIADASFDAVGE